MQGSRHRFVEWSTTTMASNSVMEEFIEYARLLAKISGAGWICAAARRTINAGELANLGSKQWIASLYHNFPVLQIVIQ